MGKFASGIAALPRIVTLHEIEIEPVTGRGVTDQSELTLNVTAKTYRYLDDEEQAAAQPAVKEKDKGKADRKGKKKPAEGGA
jgi:type IV pilus assembly protein PilO